MTRLGWNLLGFTALALGGIGAVLPLLPTTPLVILAVFAFGKGSPRLAARIEANPAFGPAIRDWRARGAIGWRAKAAACLVMALTLAASLLAGLAPAIVGVQAACMAAVGAFILTRPS